MKNLSTILLFCSILVFVYVPDRGNAQTSWWVNPNNPVINNGQTGEWDEGTAFLANIVFYNDTFYLFYTGSTFIFTQPTAIGFATSTDGMTFTKYIGNPILEGDGSGFDAFGVNQAAVTVVNSTWFLYYSTQPSLIFGPGPAIGLATSSNPGGPWTRLENPVLEVGSSGEWDAGYVGPNTVIETDTGFVMYYLGADVNVVYGGVSQVGMAFSTDGINWVKYDDPLTTDPPFAESDPVLWPGVSGSWDDTYIYGLSVLETGNGWEMFYSGSDGALDQIGFATSSDGIQWVKYISNPVLTPLEDPYASGVLEFPSAVFYNNNDTLYYYLYYDYGIGGGIGFAKDTSDYIVSVESIAHILNGYELYQNFPNPFNPETAISFNIPEESLVRLTIYNTLGELIETIVDERKFAGNYEVTWHSLNRPSGVYFYILEASSLTGKSQSSITKKMILLK